MRLLLDTHAFIWWASESEKLSPRVTLLLSDPENDLFLSTASIWEMQIKFQLGKLTRQEPLADSIKKQQAENSLHILSVALEHVLALEGLPMHHKDPFDRMLVAQAKVEDLVLVTHDSQLGKYPIKTLW